MSSRNTKDVETAETHDKTWLDQTMKTTNVRTAQRYSAKGTYRKEMEKYIQNFNNPKQKDRCHYSINYSSLIISLLFQQSPHFEPRRDHKGFKIHDTCEKAGHKCASSVL